MAIVDEIEKYKKKGKFVDCVERLRSRVRKVAYVNEMNVGVYTNEKDIYKYMNDIVRKLSKDLIMSVNDLYKLGTEELLNLKRELIGEEHRILNELRTRVILTKREEKKLFEERDILKILEEFIDCLIYKKYH